MTMTNARPVLAALDIPRLVDFYEERLGFKASWKDEGYGIVHRDQITIHFWHAKEKIFPENTSCYVDVEGIDALYEEYQKAGVIHPNGQLANQPWGMREFAILDLDGNLIRFGQEMN